MDRDAPEGRGHYIVPGRPEQGLITQGHGGAGPLRLVHLAIGERLCVDQQIRTIDSIDADRGDALPVRLAEPVMMSAEVQPRPERREHVVDRRFPRVASSWLRARPR